MNSNQADLIELLKEYEIKDICYSAIDEKTDFISRLRQDLYFNLIKGEDLRSVSYLAVGMINERARPVVVFCSNVFSIKNTMPAMTEAFYSKLPILLISESNTPMAVEMPSDVFGFTVFLGKAEKIEDRINNDIKINLIIKRLLSSNPTPGLLIYSPEQDEQIERTHRPQKILFSIKSLSAEDFNNKKVAFLIGNHRPFSEAETTLIERVCEKTDAIVITQVTSNYFGKKTIQLSEVKKQKVVFDILFVLGKIFKEDELPNSKYIYEIVENDRDFLLTPKLRGLFCLPLIDILSALENHSFKNDLNYEEKYFTNIVMPFIKIEEKDTLFVGSNSLLKIFNEYKFKNVCYSNAGCSTPTGILSMALGYSLLSSNKVFVFMDKLELENEINVLGNRYFPKNLEIICVDELPSLNNIAAAIGAFGFSVSYKNIPIIKDCVIARLEN